MSDPKLPFALVRAAPRRLNELELQTADLIEMASQLGPRDVAVLVAIVRRAAEISETQGEDMAVAVLDQIHGILNGRTLDA